MLSALVWILNVSLRCPYVKGTKLWNYWEVVEPTGNGRDAGHWEHDIKGNLGVPMSLLFFFFVCVSCLFVFLSIWRSCQLLVVILQQVHKPRSNLPHGSSMVYFLTTGPKAIEPTNSGKTSETISQKISHSPYQDEYLRCLCQ